MLIYRDQAAQAKVNFPTQLSGWCPKWNGEYYNEMGFQNQGFSWIYNPVLSQPYSNNGATSGLPGWMWVEIMHSKWPQDGEATWFYYTPGSAMWMWLGNTKVYNNHPDAMWDLLGEKCKVKQGDLPGECELQFSEMYSAAIDNAYDSVQFLYHSDMACGGGRGNLALEIVDVHGPGRHACSGYGGVTRFRAGWEAKAECKCDDSKATINCAGFGMWR